jgi:exopolyphosphatase / guanosine-5'-triphosphate,3'-diphosphate pyrophosphatase
VAPTPLAVIDIGSNSGRVVVFRPNHGHLDILADSREPLRLAREINRDGKISDEAAQRTVMAVRDFMAVARGAGAPIVRAVATSAIREAENGASLRRRIKDETGIDIEVIGGDREAAHAFLGATHGLPVQAGLLIDVGGGSIEVTQFAHRGMVTAWSLPIGALRMADRFLTSDPPAEGELEALRAHVRASLRDAGVPPITGEEQLVGTGGTVRNLARVDERRRRYFIPHLHGYVLPLDRVRGITATLAGRKTSKRREVAGLNADRADSIVGGAVAIEILMDHVGASAMMVSAQGLREGVALAELGHRVMPPFEVRRSSLAGLAARFSSFDPARAERRARIGSVLRRGMECETTPEGAEALRVAATVLDLGRAVDYYDRFREASRIVLGADLIGFSHDHLAMAASILLEADGERPGKPLTGPLSKADRAWIRQAAVILALAEEVDSRTAPGESAEISCRMDGKQAIIRAPALAARDPRDLSVRFRRAFRRRLRIEGDA